MFFAVFVVLYLPVSCSLAAVPRPDAVGDLFPDVPGFAVAREKTVYEASTLWDFIDGAADLFVSYGFVDLHIAYYHGSGGCEIRAEVYRHDSGDGAFGIYSQERSPENHFVAIGVQGYVDDGMLNFLAGSYYVKLSTNQGGQAVADSMMSIARAIELGLAQQPSWPRNVALLPVTGVIPNTEQFIAESYLGYTFLHGAYTARYMQSNPFEVFVIPAESPEAATGMASHLAEVNHLPPYTAGVLQFKDVHQGEMSVIVQGRFFSGVVHCTDPRMRAKYVEILQTSLK
jgi:hypothetical protein